jgi:hypothetical protein
MTLEKRIITAERRAELADLVWFFEGLIKEDRRQKSLQKYETLHR